MITHLAKFRDDHFKYSKLIAIALVMYNLGKLNFLKSRRKEAMQKFGTSDCLARHPLCIGEKDSAEHVFGLNGKQKCLGYQTQWNEKEIEPEPGLSFGRYLVSLHFERAARWPYLWGLIAGLS